MTVWDGRDILSLALCLKPLNFKKLALAGARVADFFALVLFLLSENPIVVEVCLTNNSTKAHKGRTVVSKHKRVMSCS